MDKHPGKTRASGKADDAKVESFSQIITMKDISVRAGVSIGTVDRALHGRGRISEETRKRVLQIADELKYQRNSFARALSVHNTIRILAIYPLEPVRYMENFSNGFREAMESLSGFGLQLDVLRPKTLRPDDFLTITRDLDIRPYDGILINAGGPRLDPFIDQAIAQKKLVATFNSDTPTSRRMFFCGEDHWAAGALSGELIARMIRGEGRVRLFSGSFSVHALQERTRGFVDFLRSDYPEVKVVSNISHEDSMDMRMERAEQVLFDGPLPDAVFCNNAIGTYPVCHLVEKYHVRPQPVIVGYDEDQALEQMLQKGICTALLYQNPRLQAHNALKYMFNCLYEHQPVPSPEKCLIVPTIILRNNIGVCHL